MLDVPLVILSFAQICRFYFIAGNYTMEHQTKKLPGAVGPWTEENDIL